MNFQKINGETPIIAVSSQKGGVGKTTTAINISAAFSLFHHKKVLLIDLDPQGHVEKSLGSLVPPGLEYKPLSQTLSTKKSSILDSVIRTNIEKLDITPGDKGLGEAEGALSSKIGREFILKNCLKPALGLYDLIVIDCPPNLGTLTINALCAASHILVPCEMSVLAFEGVTDLLDTLETITEGLNSNLSILGIVFTRVDQRQVTMNALVEENLKTYFKGHFFKTRITVNTDLNKSQLEGVPIFQFAPSCSGSVNYRALSDEVIKKIKKTS